MHAGDAWYGLDPFFGEEPPNGGKVAVQVEKLSGDIPPVSYIQSSWNPDRRRTGVWVREMRCILAPRPLEERFRVGRNSALSTVCASRRHWRRTINDVIRNEKVELNAGLHRWPSQSTCLDEQLPGKLTLRHQHELVVSELLCGQQILPPAYSEEDGPCRQGGRGQLSGFRCPRPPFQFFKVLLQPQSVPRV